MEMIPVFEAEQVIETVLNEVKQGKRGESFAGRSQGLLNWVIFLLEDCYWGVWGFATIDGVGQ